MKKLVNIILLNVLNTDARGITASFTICREQSNFLFLTRKSGSISGNTYHEGKSPATSPKTFILISGKLSLSYRKIGTTDVFTEIVTAPAVIEIQPFVTHKVEVIEDISLLECNSIRDIENDRVKEAV